MTQKKMPIALTFKKWDETVYAMQLQPYILSRPLIEEAYLRMDDYVMAETFANDIIEPIQMEVVKIKDLWLTRFKNSDLDRGCKKIVKFFIERLGKTPDEDWPNQK